MDAQLASSSSQAFPPDTISSFSTINLDARRRLGASRPAAQHRPHPYIIPERKPLGHLIPATVGRIPQRGGAPYCSSQLQQSAGSTSSFGTNPGVSLPSMADQRRLAGPVMHQSFPLTAANVAPSTRLIPPNLIPDLTELITRCSQDPVSGGTYGNIYKCIYHGPDGDVDVAVKAIRPQFIHDEVFRKELGIWKRLRHSSILKFMGTTSDFGPSIALVAPWIANGTLTSFLNQNNRALALLDRLRLLHDIAAGLDYLHTFSFTADGNTYFNPVVHGDLTGTNILIDSDGKAYLADFGLSGTLEQLTGMTYLAKTGCHPGAVRWAAPELLTGEESASAVTTQSDIYSFGSIMLQVFTGNVPWCHLTREFQITYQVAIEEKQPPRPDSHCVTEQYWNFMTRCWSKTPIDRPSAKEALQFVESDLTRSGADGGGQHHAIVPVSRSAPPLVDPSPSSTQERHPGVARNDYFRGNIDARLLVIQDIDSPSDAQETYPAVMLPAYPSSSLEPSWPQSSASILPWTYTSDFSPMYNTHWLDDENYTTIPSGYPLTAPVNTLHQNFDLNVHQTSQFPFNFPSHSDLWDSIRNDQSTADFSQSAGHSDYMQNHSLGELFDGTREDIAKNILASGDSPFASSSFTQPLVRKNSQGGNMVPCEGSNFPKAKESPANIEVLKAWRTITSHPQFKDADINELCTEFTKKARCDGKKIVLEPEGVHDILETFKAKSLAQKQQQQQLKEMLSL